MSDEKAKSNPKENNVEDTPENNKPEAAPKKPEVPKKKSSPILWITRVVLVLVLFIFTWYVFSDRNTPYTDQARITELIMPITPRVSGYLTEVNIKLHSKVNFDDLLFQIDTVPFVIAIKKASANVDNVAQQMGAQGASIKAAASSVGVSKAQLDRAQRNYDRIQRILEKNPGAVSQADIDRVETARDQATEKLATSEANLEKAKKSLGDTGPDNPQLRLAVAELERAELDLFFTSIYASDNGYIESFNLDVGYYCQAGQPLATLVSKHDLWIQADFRENNLSKMKPGNKVEFILDIAPGKIFEGTVRSIGYGVDSGNSVNRGGLPSIGNSSSWLRDPQRFPVSIEITDTEAQQLCRAGGQADVVVFTGDNNFLNRMARYRIWINSWLSYVR